MRGRTCEDGSQLAQIESVLLLEPGLSHPMLLCVMVRTEAHDPPIGRLESCAPVGAYAYVRTFDRQPFTVWHGAVVLSDPGAVGGT